MKTDSNTIARLIIWTFNIGLTSGPTVRGDALMGVILVISIIVIYMTLRTIYLGEDLATRICTPGHWVARVLYGMGVRPNERLNVVDLPRRGYMLSTWNGEYHFNLEPTVQQKLDHYAP